MIKSAKKYVVAMISISVLVSAGFLYSVHSGNSKEELGVHEKREQMRLKIEHMRKEIQSARLTFSVDYNPAMQYPIEQLCSFNPELRSPDLDNQPPVEEIDFSMGKPQPGVTSYIAAYTSIKDQGSCGGCWAFSTAGMFESVLLKNGISVDLSEQWLISCNTQGWGCNGGWFANDYYRNPGAVLEGCFRYKALDIPCKTGCPYPYKATGSYNVSSIDAIKNAIKNYGAVSCAVTVTNYFQAYSGGVFNYNSSASVNHAVVLVGWDDSLGANGAWRMKNSWGRSWGEGGLMWIEYGCSNIGHGANYLTY